MDFVNKKINQYSENHTSPVSDLLSRITRETHLHVLMPRMLSGHTQGRFLAMISKMCRPNRILEIGTFTGYSAICLAEGLPTNGTLVTIDKNEELEERVRSYFDQIPFETNIDYRVGEGMALLKEIEGPFDLVFIDADKVNYQNYYEAILDKVNQSGIIIADNVLWSGKVSDENANDKDTQALRKFNDYVQSDDRVENVLLPVRDGLMLIMKK